MFGVKVMLKYKIKKKIKSEEGQAMVEFALVLPLLLLILCGILDFGWLFYNQFNVDNTARQAARTICTECADRDFNDTVDDAVEIVRDQIYNEDTLPETGGVTVELLDQSGNVVSNVKQAESIRVTVKINMPIWTFVLQTIQQSKTRTVVSSATYKIESGTVTEAPSSP